MAHPRHCIGIVVDQDPFASSEITEGISQYVTETKSCKENKAWLARTIADNTASVNAIIKARHCDSFVFRNGPRPILRRLFRDGIDVVNIEPASPALDPPVTCVEPNNVRVGEIGAQHLLGLGFPRFAFLSFSPGGWSQDRCRGFAAAVRAAGKPYIELPTPRSASYTDVRDGDIILKLLEKLQRPVAVMVADDVLARRAVEICADNGWIVPDDIAVLGVGNGQLFREAPPVSVSSIDLNRHQMGYVAAQCLERATAKKSRPRQTYRIEPRGVIVRESTAALGFSDIDIKAAVQFIRERAFEGIAVDDVARHVSLSRSTLERRFFDAMHRSPSDEIRHIRLECAEKLLRQTNRSVFDIALDIGFSSLPYLCHAFKKHFGLTPRDYRRKMTSQFINTLR